MWKRHITGTDPAKRFAGGLFLLTALAAPRAFPQAAEIPLQVQGVHVVFFGPGRAERDSIAQSEGLEIDDLLDDFNLSAGKAAVYLSRNRIPSEFTECRIVIVKTGAGAPRTFDRRSIPDPVGMILTDGVHEPRIVPGRGTERDLIREIREYFHLREGTDE